MSGIAAAVDPRSESRANVFLAATLTMEGSSVAVRVRNMSPMGALLDCPNPPAEGATVRLRRGSLEVVGEVAWRSEARYCGIRFDTEVQLKDWLKPVGHAGQRRVDELIASLRVGREQTARSFATADELAEICAEIGQASLRIASSSGLSVQLAEELVRIDAAVDRLRKLGASAA